MVGIYDPQHIVDWLVPGRELFLALHVLGVACFIYIVSKRLVPLLRAHSDPRFDRPLVRLGRVFKFWLGIPKPRADWRLRRWTAKHAVAACINLPDEPSTFADIEIRAASSGAPGVFLQDRQAEIAISLSHSPARPYALLHHRKSASAATWKQLSPGAMPSSPTTSPSTKKVSSRNPPRKSVLSCWLCSGVQRKARSRHYKWAFGLTPGACPLARSTTGTRPAIQMPGGR